MTTVLGADVGGSGTRVAVVDGDRRWTASGAGVRVGPGGIDVVAVVEAVARLAEGLAEDGAPAPRAVAVAMTGLVTLADAPERALGAVVGRLGVPVAVVVPDVVAALAGAVGGTAGAVVAAGTGAVALAGDGRRTWRRADGWGHLLGDDGGGAWVGQAGLRAAVRAHDGRPGGSLALLAALRARFGAPEDLPRALYPREDRAGVLASFAPDVAAAAAAGDPVASRVWEQAGEHLAGALLAVCEAVPGVPASWTGGLTAAGDLLLAPLRSVVAARAPHLDLRAPLGTALDGAVALARQAAHGQGPEPCPPWVVSTPTARAAQS